MSLRKEPAECRRREIPDSALLERGAGKTAAFLSRAVFDSMLGLGPVRVLDLLDQALAEQTGTVFQDANERLQRAVNVSQERTPHGGR
ncbi:hypothetical protein [Streptomyces gobiensis]|uniref:hypothetical protein n=1 Tax=Streptomyces gobiensis TaxID=2875706 RepID=UPI001E509172|nr:hypothetical protein [Streptomyces gobiensis]UGY92671.1 hypothetical protein test1122_13700 [Streptomyces gobiensis]